MRNYTAILHALGQAGLVYWKANPHVDWEDDCVLLVTDIDSEETECLYLYDQGPELPYTETEILSARIFAVLDTAGLWPAFERTP